MKEYINSNLHVKGFEDGSSVLYRWEDSDGWCTEWVEAPLYTDKFGGRRFDFEYSGNCKDFRGYRSSMTISFKKEYSILERIIRFLLGVK